MSNFFYNSNRWTRNQQCVHETQVVTAQSSDDKIVNSWHMSECQFSFGQTNGSRWSIDISKRRRLSSLDRQNALMRNHFTFQSKQYMARRQVHRDDSSKIGMSDRNRCNCHTKPMNFATLCRSGSVVCVTYVLVNLSNGIRKRVPCYQLRRIFHESALIIKLQFWLSRVLKFINNLFILRWFVELDESYSCAFYVINTFAMRFIYFANYYYCSVKIVKYRWVYVIASLYFPRERKSVVNRFNKRAKNSRSKNSSNWNKKRHNITCFTNTNHVFNIPLSEYHSRDKILTANSWLIFNSLSLDVQLICETLTN